MISRLLPKDWSAFDSLKLICSWTAMIRLGGSVTVHDKAGGDYWNRHNGFFNLKRVLHDHGSGETACSAEKPAAATPPEMATSIPGRFAAGFRHQRRCEGEGHLRRLPAADERVAPGRVLAFDLGPESQTLFPGFTGISWNTVYGQNGAKAWLKQACGAPIGRATTRFQPGCTGFCLFEENNNEFIADVSNGKCHVWMVFDDCGYWGGETCHHHKRACRSTVRNSWVDDRRRGRPGRLPISL